MLSWIISVFLLATSIRALGHPKYECGDHGRFEYCIDGIPGCIVGCHCHPGYYFDTETKICEPNVKLVQDYRRLYFGETTRRPLEAYSSDTENDLTSTTLNPIEPQIDNIAKDADDLGDWLYNQFFKTIESQVINKTETVRPPTRRSESGPGNFSKSTSKDIKNKSGRRNEGKSRKKLKAQGRKDKKKKTTLRRKLLRISEDDSLFDSSDSQETYTDSSTESDYSDTSDSEGTSHESDKGGNGKRCDKDGEHGHRKILMINKKPKLPLPPFIFLPQLDTPFYPPIPLPPPPPVMPMYPVIPVPPMPPFPYPVPYPDDDKTETTTKKDNTTTEKPDNKTNKTPDDVTTVKPDDTTTPSSGDDTESNRDANNETDATETPSLRNLKKKKNVSKKNLRLGKTSIADGEQMKKKNKRKKKPITPPDPLMDMYSPQDLLVKDFDKDNFISKTKQLEDESAPSDVDFKYLAQLIHKMGPNDTKMNDDTKWDMVTPLRRTLSQIQGTGNNLIKNDDFFQTRRNVDTQGRNLERHDDLYYTKLGQQIASLIRNVDGTNGRQSEQVSNSLPNIDVDHRQLGPNLFNQSSSSILQGSSFGPDQNPYLYNAKKSAPSSSQQILYENYGPRSYWERSVRSLFNHFRRYPEELHPKTDNLYNLENRLIIVASTERTLSLTELENILTIMTKAKTQLQKHTYDILPNDTGNENLNVNLLPQHMEVKTSAQNDNTFHRPTKTNTPTKEIHVNSDEIVLDKDDVVNLNLLSNKKKITNSNTSPNRKPLPNITKILAKVQLTNVTPNDKRLGTINMTHIIKQSKNIDKMDKEKENKKFNMSPNKKSLVNLNLSNIALNTSKTNFITIKNERISFDNMAPTKQDLTIFKLIPNFKETVKTFPYEKNTLISNASNDQQQQEKRSMVSNVHRNLQGVLLHNFRNISTLITSIPNIEIRNHKNNSHMNFKNILDLQRLTTNKLKEITNAHNQITKVTWITPKVAQFITNPEKTSLEPSDIKETYRKTSIFPGNRPIFIGKPLRFQLPVKTQVFRRPQMFFKHDVNGGSYFSHHLNIFK